MAHKIEADGFLWRVLLSTGTYSDYAEEVFVISAGDEKEARELFKVFLQDISNGFQWYGKNMPHGIVFGDGERFQWNLHADPDREMEWNSKWNSYCQDCRIERLKVIHVTKTWA